MTEIERLRADLEVFERYSKYGNSAVTKDIREKITKLEAAADPWRDAKTMIEGWRKDILSGRHISPAGENAVHLFDHLTAENARLEKRVKELEAEPEFTPAVLKRADEIVIGDVILAGNSIQTVTEIDSSHSIQRIIKCDGWMAWFYNGDLIAVLPNPLVEAKTVADMQPPFKGPIESIEPVLDPARVLATAEIALRARKWPETAHQIRAIWRGIDRNAKPYRLKGADE